MGKHATLLHCSLWRILWGPPLVICLLLRSKLVLGRISHWSPEIESLCGLLGLQRISQLFLLALLLIISSWIEKPMACVVGAEFLKAAIVMDSYCPLKLRNPMAPYSWSNPPIRCGARTTDVKHTHMTFFLWEQVITRNSLSLKFLLYIFLSLFCCRLPQCS